MKPRDLTDGAQSLVPYFVNPIGQFLNDMFRYFQQITPSFFAKNNFIYFHCDPIKFAIIDKCTIKYSTLQAQSKIVLVARYLSGLAPLFEQTSRHGVFYTLSMLVP